MQRSQVIYGSVLGIFSTKQFDLDCLATRSIPSVLSFSLSSSRAEHVHSARCRSLYSCIYAHHGVQYYTGITLCSIILTCCHARSFRMKHLTSWLNLISCFGNAKGNPWLHWDQEDGDSLVLFHLHLCLCDLALHICQLWRRYQNHHEVQIQIGLSPCHKSFHRQERLCNCHEVLKQLFHWHLLSCCSPVPSQEL